MRMFTSMGRRPINELGIAQHRAYETKYRAINSLKIQPGGGNLLAAANELGSIFLYDLIAETDLPQQFRILSFESGGISELFWVSADILVAGTTRGNLVVFSLKNDARRLFEICNVKAHGDGASLVAVQSIDFCANTNCLVSVGQGVGSVRLWDVECDGVLKPRDIPNTVAFCEPRFVSFTDNGSHILVGFLEHIKIQKFTVAPFALLEEHTLGQDNGAVDGRQLGNAVFLGDNRLVVFNVKDGFDIYDTSKFIVSSSGRYDVNFCCSQGISALRDGTYIVALSTRGRLNIYQTRDHEVRLAATIKSPDNGGNFQAIHAHSSGDHDIIAAASCIDGDESTITIWMDGPPWSKPSKNLPSRSGHYSTLQIVTLSILVYIICQLVTSLILLPNLGFLSTSLAGPILDVNQEAPDPVKINSPRMTASFQPRSSSGASYQPVEVVPEVQSLLLGEPPLELLAPTGLEKALSTRILRQGRKFKNAHKPSAFSLSDKRGRRKEH